MDNPRLGFTILGIWLQGSGASYEQVAHRAGATYFDMGDAYHIQRTELIVNNVDDSRIGEGFWQINRSFLDQQVARCRIFFLSSSPRSVAEGTSFWREIEYLESLGYQAVQEDDYWMMVQP